MTPPSGVLAVTVFVPASREDVAPSTLKCREVNRGSDWADGDLITRTSDIPTSVAETLRSTPGRTSEYVAVESEILGIGRVP
jgi:hypothetical protein